MELLLKGIMDSATNKHKLNTRFRKAIGCVNSLQEDVFNKPNEEQTQEYVRIVVELLAENCLDSYVRFCLLELKKNLRQFFNGMSTVKRFIEVI